MVSLEQVRLLESKVTRAIDYVQKVTEENTSLRGKLDSYQKRIDELEVLIQQFKEEQSQIEDGILSSLHRLNQFEDALERTISADLPEDAAPVQPETPKDNAASKKETPVKKEKEAPASTLEPEPAAENESESEDSKSGEELDIF